MYIRLSKYPDKDEYKVYLVESYRNEKGESRQRVLKSYGDLSELRKDNPHALEELKAWAKAETKRQKESGKIDLIIDLNKHRDKGSKTPLNYGYVFLRSVYRALGINAFIQEQQAAARHAYPLEGILELLVYSRCLNPASKKKTYEGKGNYFFEFPDVSLDDVYRSLSTLGAMKDDLTKHLHKRIDAMRGRDCSLVFYDVTNYYFESEQTSGLRQRGVSKEKRKTGIVQMGLFIDAEGIPITYELFPGNTNDMRTMRPILKKIKKDYGLGKITIVADKGNNTGENLAHIDASGDHYIISQRIRNRGKGLTDLVLDPTGYVWNKEGTFKHKATERMRVVKRADGSEHAIKEHVLCFWSEGEEHYQQQKRGHLDEKLKRFIDHPSLLNASNAFGLKKYFKKELIDKTTGEVLKGKPHYTFDQTKYERDTALDGYYCIVTNDLDLSPLDIIKHYHQLSKIEESFKITKTDLEGRPVYVWTDDHIRGHFLTCYLALTLYRLLQLKLDRPYPVHQLKEALNSATAVHLEKNYYLLHDTTEVFGSILDVFDVDLNHEYIRFETLKKKLNNITY